MTAHLHVVGDPCVVCDGDNVVRLHFPGGRPGDAVAVPCPHRFGPLEPVDEVAAARSRRACSVYLIGEPS